MLVFKVKAVFYHRRLLLEVFMAMDTLFGSYFHFCLELVLKTEDKTIGTFYVDL